MLLLRHHCWDENHRSSNIKMLPSVCHVFYDWSRVWFSDDKVKHTQIAAILLQIFVIFFHMNAFPLRFQSTPFLLDFPSVCQLSSEIRTNVYSFIVSSKGASAVLFLTVMHWGTQQGYTEMTEGFSHALALKKCVLFFFPIRVWLSELLLWWWSVWLDQGQRWRPALGDDAWSIR